jgi:PAS domain S-box-containing protein
LAIVREFVAAHRGTISIDQAPDGGALFIVDLPAKAPAGSIVAPEPTDTPRQAKPLPPNSPDVGARKPKLSLTAPLVLVIEDNLEMNRFIVESLSDRYRVESAHDGDEGLEKARRYSPNLILCDLMMPIKSGEEFIREARRHPSLESTPIIVLSAKSDDALRIQLLREGVQDYLVKPFSVEELRARVDNWVVRCQVEKEVREAEEKYRGIIAVCADAIVVIDENQDIVEWNQGAEKIFGYSLDEILGRQVNTLIPARYHKAHQSHIHRFADDGREARILDHSRTVGQRKTGEEFPMAATISRLRIRDQWLMTAVVRDISEEKRREEELGVLAFIGAILASLDDEHTLHDVVRTLARTLADSAALYLLEGEKNDQLRLAASENRNTAVAAYENKVHQACFVPGSPHPIWDIVNTRRGFILEPTPELYASPEPAPVFREGMRAANPRSILAVPLVMGDRCLGVLRIWSASRIYDARDLALMEEIGRRCSLFIENARLHRSERLAIRARDDILGVVAHDLRSPLGVILLEAANLEQMSPADEEITQITWGIKRSARRMQRIINDLLDIVGLDSGKMSLRLTLQSAVQLVADAAEAQAPLLTSAKLEHRIDVADGLPAILADRHRILQVFENLVGNAIKFSKAGQTITIGAKQQGNAVVFWVRDQGMGIEPEHWTHIFDRFWHGDTRNGAGTGLGLAIVKGIVELHGGRAWVESRIGDGSTFYFMIPVALLAAAS